MANKFLPMKSFAVQPLSFGSNLDEWGCSFALTMQEATEIALDWSASDHGATMNIFQMTKGKPLLIKRVFA
jgi:hypothetical protein